jgi:hypothetical protein
MRDFSGLLRFARNDDVEASVDELSRHCEARQRRSNPVLL